MAKNSSIEWTHHTFNPWWGCTKVSAACSHCYAEAWAKRVGKSVWGAKAPRRFFGENYWHQPIKWNSEAADAGTRTRVFCASMADVFEDRRDLDSSRDRLWKIIDATPWLDWLLLTKRPEKVAVLQPWSETWPSNVWLGTTVESQKWAERRIEALLANNAKVRFLSCEPLLGSLDLREWLSSINWVIAGGESGPKARPMRPGWLRTLRDDCNTTGVAFHFKQWGDWFPLEDAVDGRTTASAEAEPKFKRLGKKQSGRVLDGRTWDEIPAQWTLPSLPKAGKA